MEVCQTLPAVPDSRGLVVASTFVHDESWDDGTSHSIRLSVEWWTHDESKTSAEPALRHARNAFGIMYLQV